MKERNAQNETDTALTVHATLMREVETQEDAAPLRPDPDGMPKGLADFFRSHGIQIKYYTDDMDGTFFHALKKCYKVEQVLANSEGYVIYEVSNAGIILPTEEQKKARWLICCTAAGNWGQAKDVRDRLEAAAGKHFSWRALDITQIQNDRRIITCPQNYIFKICRFI